MRFLHLLALIILVTLVVTTTNAEAKKGKKKKGCSLNNKYYRPGKIAYRDKSHCLKLKCFKVKDRKGKVKYLLRPRSYRNCQCFPILCRGKRCSPPEPCPICTEIWEPVCGANNKTYSNECQMWGQMQPCGPDDTELLHYGECGKCPTGCPKNMDPVCGSDGNTYNNECLLQTAACETNSSIMVVKEGECNGSSNSSELCGKCTKERHPVCGSNGVTYSNQCVLESAAECRGENVTLAHEGACSDDPIVIQPIKRNMRKSQCKYNGKRYDSGEMIADLIDYCLTIACQPTRRARGNKIVFQDFQGANACDCSSDKLRKQILRLSRL